MSLSMKLSRRITALSKTLFTPHFLSYLPDNPIFYRHFHTNQFPISPELPDNILNDSNRICQILSTLPKSGSLDSVLPFPGLKITPVLVFHTLTKLNNVGLVALGFFRWAENQPGFEYTTDIYNALIDSLGKRRRFTLVWDLVDSMNRDGLLTRSTFNVIIRKYARASMFAEARRTFDRMETFGIKPDVSDFNSFLDNLCKAKLVVDADKVFDEMKRKRFKPDKKSYTILLEGWGSVRNLLKLEEVYWEMRAEGFEPDVIAYGIIMNAYCKSRKVDRAMEKFEEMRSKGIEPSPHIYCILINALGSDLKLSVALKYFELSRSAGVAPEAPTYNAVVGAYCWSGQFDEAFRVVEEMRKFGIGPNARTYDIILHHLVKGEEYEEAYLTFRKMGNEEGSEPTLSTYEIILRMLCHNGELDKAVQVWDEMEAKGIVPGLHLFIVMISNSRREDELDIASKYLVKMIDLGIRPSVMLFTSVKKALISQGKNETVEVLYKKLHELKSTPSRG